MSYTNPRTSSLTILKRGILMHLVLINKNAGNGKAKRYWRKLEKQLKHANLTYQVFWTSTIEDTTNIVRQAKQSSSVESLIIIGGDGTVHTVIQEMLHTNLPLAIFPAGSGNDVARSFHLTKNAKTFVKKLTALETTTIDVLNINNRLCITVAGVGIDTMIGKIANEAAYKSFFNRIGLGAFPYMLAIFQAAIRFQPFETTVHMNHEKIHIPKTWLIASGNTTSYGGGLIVCPEANPKDGAINMTAFHSLPKLQALATIFPALLTGKKLHTKGVTYDKGSVLHIATTPVQEVILDGEINMTTPISLTVIRNAIPIIQTTD